VANIHQQELLDSIANLMNDPTDADYTIICEGREWPVHKAIISQASTVLASSCHSSMREGLTNTYEITGFGAEIVGYMVSYIYRRDYALGGEYYVPVNEQEINDDEPNNEKPNINYTLLAHVEVFGIGGFFEIDLLKALAADKFAAATAKVGWQPTGFIEVVERINERSIPSDRRHRNALRQHAMQHRGEIIRDASLMTQLAGLEGVQYFAADMLQ
jgi:hypothetical protein